MAYTKSADGIASRGKTNATVLPNSGPNAKATTGGKKSAGVSDASRLKLGRNLSRVANQTGG
jgi:hypothetical protein